MVYRANRKLKLCSGGAGDVVSAGDVASAGDVSAGDVASGGFPSHGAFLNRLNERHGSCLGLSK